MTSTLKAPFPYFGGKSRAASLIWERLGNTPNYVEPFAGSLAVLLGRPHAPKVETVNDKDCYLANFWRALKHDPEAVAHHADWPVNEADLHARHRWLIAQADFRERMLSEPEFYDAKVAGWWVWGLCSWIGSGWCSGAESAKTPRLSGDQGIHRGSLHPSQQMPHVGNAGRGLHRPALYPSRKIPEMGSERRVRSPSRAAALAEYLIALADRLRRVRVCCGEWDRVLGESVTVKHGLTAILLDPPYDQHESYYSEANAVAANVRTWAIENGDNPLLRIALCGYEGEHEMPESWACVPWKAAGGYGGQRKDGTKNENSARERIWFSPHCLTPMTLFTMLEAA